MDFYIALGMIAPYYNLALVIIALWLFIILFRTPPRKAFMKPWYLLFICMSLYIVEEVLTVARAGGLTQIPHHINAFFELGIIIIFIYLLLVQREHVRRVYRPHKLRR